MRGLRGGVVVPGPGAGGRRGGGQGRRPPLLGPLLSLEAGAPERGWRPHDAGPSEGGRSPRVRPRAQGRPLGAPAHVCWSWAPTRYGPAGEGEP